MKMKRLFNFFAIAAIIAVGLTGCSSEEPVGTGTDPSNGQGPVVEGEDTYVTLNFNADDKPLTRGNVSGDASETVDVNIIRVTVFDALDKMEHDAEYSAATATFKLISGAKKLFILVNPTADINTKLGTVGSGIGVTTLSEWNQEVSLDNASTPTNASIDKIGTLYASGDFTYSTLDNVSIALAPNVTEADSKLSTNSNNFTVNVYRTVAKMFVSQTHPSGNPVVANKTITLDSTGIITTTTAPTYRVMNVLASLYPFQKINGPDIVTPFAASLAAISSVEDPANDALVDAIANPYFDRGGATLVGVGTAPLPSGDIPIITGASATPIAGQSYYITENINGKKRATTFAVIKAQFTPTQYHYITNATYNNTGEGRFSQTIANTDASTGTTFYLLTKLPAATLVTGISANTIIVGSKALARKIVYHLENPTEADKGEATEANYSSSVVTDAKLNEYIGTYTSGWCYYRLNVGEGAGSALKAGVKRNYHYKMNIDAYNRLGAVSPADLLGSGNNDEETWLTVTVNIIPWTVVTGSGNV
jgi:hypothetical protein